MAANGAGSVAPGTVGWPTIPIGKTAALNWFVPWCPCRRLGGRCAGCVGVRANGARPDGTSPWRGSGGGRRGGRRRAVGHGADVTGIATPHVHLLAAVARDGGPAGDLAGGPLDGIGAVPDRFGRHRASQGRCLAGLLLAPLALLPRGALKPAGGDVFGLGSGRGFGPWAGADRWPWRLGSLPPVYGRTPAGAIWEPDRPSSPLI